jgi:molecular chaperone DnaJ
MPKDYYIVLGVSRGADLKKIKQAYRREVKKYHPDTRRTDEPPERFLEIKEAYNTLSDEIKRRDYDRELEREGSLLRISRAPEHMTKRRSVFDATDTFSSFVDEFFSGFVPGFFDQSIGKKKNLYLDIILSPREAQNGGLYPLTVPVVEPCPRCSRTGVWEDFFCPVCYGYGRIHAKREFSLSIPPHIQHGTEITLSLEDIGLRSIYLNVTVLINAALEEEW